MSSSCRVGARSSSVAGVGRVELGGVGGVGGSLLLRIADQIAMLDPIDLFQPLQGSTSYSSKDLGEIEEGLVGSLKVGRAGG